MPFCRATPEILMNGLHGLLARSSHVMIATEPPCQSSVKSLGPGSLADLHFDAYDLHAMHMQHAGRSTCQGHWGHFLAFTKSLREALTLSALRAQRMY